MTWPKLIDSHQRARLVDPLRIVKNETFVIYHLKKSAVLISAKKKGWQGYHPTDWVRLRRSKWELASSKSTSDILALFFHNLRFNLVEFFKLIPLRAFHAQSI